MNNSDIFYLAGEFADRAADLGRSSRGELGFGPSLVYILPSTWDCPEKKRTYSGSEFKKIITCNVLYVLLKSDRAIVVEYDFVRAVYD